MISRIAKTSTSPRLNGAERRALLSLRLSYQGSQQVFTEKELARLRFVRWFVHTPNYNRGLDYLDPIYRRPAVPRG